MTIVWIKGKKLNICLKCGNKIVNRNINAVYCKKCSKLVRKDNCKKAMDKYNKKHKLYKYAEKKKK